jgi:hypothetical protein
MLCLLTLGLGVLSGAGGAVFWRSHRSSEVVVFTLFVAALASIVIVAPACLVAVGCTKAARRLRQRLAG